MNELAGNVSRAGLGTPATNTVPRHGKGPGPRRRRRLVRAIALLTGVLTLALAATAAAVLMRMQGNITTTSLHPGGEAVITSSEGLNILVLGSDARKLREPGYGEDDGTRRSDSMMLVHLAEHDARIDAVQIPRDTLMRLPSCAAAENSFPGGEGMINAALNHGPDCSVSAVEALTGVSIDHFLLVDFDGFSDVIDALGGVPVRLPAPLRDSFAQLDLPAGEQLLNGRQALAWARVRHIIGDGSDIARLGHQQEVIRAISDRVRGENLLTRPDRLYGFLDAATKSLTVDRDLGSVTALASLGTRISHVSGKDVSVLIMPWQPAPQDPNRVVPSPEAAAVFGAMARDQPLTAHGAGAPAPSGKPVQSDSALDHRTR
ncbi:LCP family protein [Arthrobacter sp. RAF14]|uniref:LCP family protein n=1 Tax=Arthrobacter sp. RAF14 TaxID=3233051 RepID=UPI003F8E6704